MAISRSLMNRQLRANGGIMDVTPRENFGLGSSLKKFVRKIIPNEVAEIATKAAPFVAPFNPLLAAGMSGIGTFDQTGSIGDSLKAGGMNYALGQGARYIGGGAQNLQTGFNPFSGYDASAGLTRGLLTNPVSDQGGLGKFFSNQGTIAKQGVQGVGAEPQSIEGFLSQDAAKNVGLESERLAELASQTQNQFIKNSPSAMDSFKSIISFDTSAAEKGNAALDLLKRGGQAAFTKPGPNGKPMLDKAAILGTIAFAGSYIEAKALADDAGVELTEGAYDEARKTEKQEEYAGYLTNFFGGKKDGGRIGYGNGANEFMSEQMMLESNPGAAESGSPITIDTTMTGLINKYNTYKKSAPGVSEETRIFLKNDLLKSLEDAGISQEEFMMRLSEDTEMKANGGRIGYGLGDLVRGSAGVFQPTSASMNAGDAPSFEGGSGMGGMIADLIRKNPQMFKNVSGQTNSSGGPMPSGSMGGMFSTLFSNPNIYNKFIKNKKDFIDQNLNLIDDREEVANGGRIGYALGTPRDTTMFEELNADTIYRPEPDSTITLPNKMPGDDRRVDKYDDYEFDQDQKTDSIRLLADFYMREEGMSESDAYEKAVGEIYDIQLKEGGRVSRKLGSPEEGERSGVMEMLAVDVDAGGDEEENMMMAYKPGSFYKKDFKPMEVDAINERLQSFLDGEGGGLPLPLIGTVKGIANTLKAGKPVFTGPEKTTIIRNLAGRSRGTSAYKELGKSIPEAKRIMDNPIDYLKDAAIFKELLKGIFKKDGGRIGYAFGTPENKAEGRDKTVMEMGVEDTIIENPKPELPNMEVAGDILPYEKIKLWEIIGKDIYDDWSSFSEIYDKYGADRMWKGVSGRPGKKNGGRIGLKDGTGSSNRVAQLMLERDWLLSKDEDVSFIDLELERDFGIQMKAEGGVMEARVPTGQPRLNQGGVAERDYRETGGFVPVGIKERADDVPAMLSKNEFVMTADSVRGLGNGSVEEGSKKLYNTMKQAEQKGKIA
jgi:hypothetical protein